MSTWRVLPVLSLTTLALWGQEFRATVKGVVTDPSEAAIPGATVVLRNTATGIERQEAPDQSGHDLFS